MAGGTVGGLGQEPVPLREVAAPPELLSRILPEYPARARALQIEGQVMLELVLDREGRPEPAIRVVHSIALLDAAAVEAVRQWRFRPARDADGRPVRVIMQVPVRFVLR
jgi:protein TonB